MEKVLGLKRSNCKNCYKSVSYTHLRIRPHPKFLQCQRIEHPGMAGRMLQHKRIVRRGLVQKAFMRRARFLQRIVCLLYTSRCV